LAEGDGRHIIYADVARILAVVGIIAIHVSNEVLQNFANLSFSGRLAADFYSSLVRPSTNLFFMLSGLLILRPSKTPLRDFYIRRFGKVLPPFLFWSVVYYVVANRRTGLSLGGFAASFVTGTVYYHLWFVYVILALYLIAPALMRWAEVSPKTLLLLVPAAYAVRSYIDWEFSSTLGTSHLTEGLFYFVLGWALYSYKLPEVFYKFAAPLFFAAFLFTAAVTYALSGRQNALDMAYFGTMTVNVFFMSVSAFMVIQRAAYPKSHSFVKNIANVSGAAYGVYLVHLLAYMAVWRLGASPYLVHPVVGIPLTVAAIFISSLALVLFFQKIPFLRRLT
jgi:surface polysaccharide O-acyltransferase-like enzyme